MTKCSFALWLPVTASARNEARRINVLGLVADIDFVSPAPKLSGLGEVPSACG